jgi:uncharacterized surface protein with fasciclin (FAS1) repeats
MSNITQVINTDKNLKTLKKGVHASDMDQLLSSSGPFTFFAPTDLAFDKLEKGFMDNLLEKENRLKLDELIKSHVVTGKINYKDLNDGDKLTTLNNTELLISVKNGVASIGDAILHSREAKVTNGVIHISDTVLNN